MTQKGFTLIELIIAIAIIGILAGVAIPVIISITEDAHQANMDGVEGTMNSVVIMDASESYLDEGDFVYPAENEVTIAAMIEGGFINDWNDLGGGVWQYEPTGGTLAYSQTGGGSGYNITKSYSGESGGSGGGNGRERGRGR